jgi:ABC-type Fe3+ transport system substrate-binding protein
MRVVTGNDDILKKLWVGQEVAVGTDARQLTEFMVRGRYAVGVGAVDRRILADFQSQGLGKNVKVNPIPEIEYTNAGSNNLWIVAKAPHPKAAQVFANWVLTKEGSTIYSPNASINSRRLDVPAFDDAVRPQKGVKYLRSDDESLLDTGIKTQEMAKALLN